MTPPPRDGSFHDLRHLTREGPRPYRRASRSIHPRLLSSDLPPLLPFRPFVKAPARGRDAG